MLVLWLTQLNGMTCQVTLITHSRGLWSLVHYYTQQIRRCTFQAFHKSVYDWLTDRDASGRFFADASLGHGRIAAALVPQLQAPATASPYALHHGLGHLLAARQLAVAEKLVCDFVYWRRVFEGGFGPDVALDLLQRSQALDLKPGTALYDALRWVRLHGR